MAVLVRGGVGAGQPAGLPGHTFDNATTVTVADPIDAAAQIADAAITALDRA